MFLHYPACLRKAEHTCARACHVGNVFMYVYHTLSPGSARSGYPCATDATNCVSEASWNLSLPSNQADTHTPIRFQLRLSLTTNPRNFLATKRVGPRYVPASDTIVVKRLYAACRNMTRRSPSSHPHTTGQRGRKGKSKRTNAAAAAAAAIPYKTWTLNKTLA